MDDAIKKVEAGLKAIADGKFVILVDDEDRENEGDLVIAAEKITPEAINFMAVEARGLICLAMSGELLDKLKIPMMVSSNQSPYQTAFAVSIEARTGVTTGISAADRSRTIQVAVDDDSGPEDLVMPGHIFPLRAREGGVLVRTGQTEGSVDLAKLAGLKSAAVICEIMNPDGTMSRMADLEVFAEKHDLMILSVADLIAYRLQKQSLVRCILEEKLETEWPGDWNVKVYKTVVDDHEHFVLTCGDLTGDEPTLVRVQHRVDSFEVFTQHRSETFANLQGAMKKISEVGKGLIIYLDRPASGAKAVLRKHQGTSQDEVDVNRPQEVLRDLGIGAQILVDCGVHKIRVLTNRPRKILGTEAYGLEIVDHVPID